MATIIATRLDDTLTISDGLYNFTCTVDEFIEKNKGNALGFVREASKKTPGNYVQGVNIYCGKSASVKVDHTKGFSEEELAKFKSIKAKIKKSIKSAIELEFVLDQMGFLDAVERGFAACEATTKKVQTAVTNSLFDEIGKSLPSRTEPEVDEAPEAESDTHEAKKGE